MFTVARVLGQSPPVPAPSAGIGPTPSPAKIAAFQTAWSNIGLVMGKFSADYETSMVNLTTAANALGKDLILDKRDSPRGKV
jgi:hypothetical protein